MFPTYMSRPLVPLLLSLAMLSGCVAQKPDKTVGHDTVQAIRYPSLEQWLDLQQTVGDMSTEEVVERLTEVDRSEGIGQLFYFGVLNQQLPTYGAWTLARDTFQKLQENEELPRAHRQLAGVLRKYNQSRINEYLRQQELISQDSQLQQDLRQARDEKRQLEQKIQALTELETVISTRKEE